MDGPYSMHRSVTVIQWRICLQSKMTIWQKGVQPPKYWQKEGQIFSPTATSVFSVKSTPNQNRQRLPCSLGSSQPSIFLFFFRVHCGWTSDQKWGVIKYPSWNACARLYPAVSTKFGKDPFLARFYPFVAPCDLVCPELAQKHHRLATVPARGGCGTTKRLRPTSNRPTAQTRSNVISIVCTWSAYHRARFSDYCIHRTMVRHDESSRSWVTPMSSSHASPSAPKFKNADTDT